MKVYLAKPNKHNREQLEVLRNAIKELGGVVKEYEGGGPYSNADLLQSDLLIVAPGPLLDNTTAKIGKGIESQINDFKMTHGAENIYIAYVIGKPVLVSKFVRTEITTPDHWNDVGKVHFRKDAITLNKLFNNEME